MDGLRHRARRVPWVGGALLFALLTTWALGTARYGGPDEPAHVLRAYAVAHGDARGTLPASAALDLAPGYRIVGAPATLASGDPACYRHDSTVTPNCATPGTSPEQVQAATSAGVNPPLYYALVGSLARLGDETQPLAYRFAAAALVGVALVLAAWRLGPVARRHPWAVPSAVAALTPASWFLFGVVNPNGFEIALLALAWVGVARWWCSVDERTSVAALWIGVPIALAVAARPVAFGAAAAVVAMMFLAGRPSRRAAVALVGPLVAAFGSLVAWHASLGVAVVDDPRTARPGSTTHALGVAIGGLPRSVAELVGSLGWLEYRVPVFAQVLWAAVVMSIVAALLVARRDTTGDGEPTGPRLLRATAMWLTVLAATPVVFEVVFFGSIGPIWQGRYSIPVWLGGAAVVVAASPVDSGPRRPGAVLGCLAIVETVAFWAVVQRSTVGTDGSWFFTDGVTVGAALHPRLLLLAHAAIVAVLAIGLTVDAATRSSRTGPR